MKYRVLILMILSLLVSCECPPSAVTPQEIIPTEFANICIFNAINSFSALDIDTKYGYFLTGLSYSKYTKEYKKIGSGNNLIYCKNSNSRFYSIPAYFNKNDYYTAVIVGNSNEVNTILLEDKLGSVDNNSSLLRIVNAMKYGDGLKFYNPVIGDKELKFSEFTNFSTIPTGQNSIKITYHDAVLYDILFYTKAGYTYSIVTYYDPASTNIINVSVSIIELAVAK